MTTVSVLIKDALAKRFILPPGQDPDSDQEAFGLRTLTRMLDSWGADAPILFRVSEETITLSSDVSSYSTSLLASGRPNSIKYLFNRLSDIDYPCQLVDYQTWANVVYKPVSAVPSICYYDDSYPNGTLNFYPIPYAAFVCHVFVTRPLVTGTITTSTDIVLPPGYEAAIVDNLAVYYPYEVPATADMKRDAMNGKNLLKRANYVPLKMSVPIDKNYSVNNDFPYSGF